MNFYQITYSYLGKLLHQNKSKKCLFFSKIKHPEMNCWSTELSAVSTEVMFSEATFLPLARPGTNYIFFLVHLSP